MTIIKQLQQNKKPFGLMPPELQEEIDRIPRKELESWNEHAWISVAHGSYPLHGTTTYRLRPDYTEDEYETMTTKDFEELDDAEEIIANAVGHMCDTIRKQHDEIVRLKKG